MYDQGDTEESSYVKDHHESEEYMVECNQSKEGSDEDLQDANLRIENVHGISESPIKARDDQHDEVGTFIQERVLADMNIVAPCEDVISNFLCISEGKWDMGNHQFNSDPIYDTEAENEVEIDSPFLQDITHNDIPTHTIERDDYGFPSHEEGLLEMAGPIYDTNDETNEGLVFP